MKITRQTLIGILVMISSVLPLIISYWIVQEQVAADYPWWTTGSTVAVGIFTFLILVAGGALAIGLERRKLNAANE